VKTGAPQPQQEFLRHAMSELGMTREQFAERIGTKKRTLDNWLLSPESSEYRNMPDMAWKFVQEILENRSESA
jgi:DNA-binding transcriptional regulator YiaG